MRGEQENIIVEYVYLIEGKNDKNLGRRKFWRRAVLIWRGEQKFYMLFFYSIFQTLKDFRFLFPFGFKLVRVQTTHFWKKSDFLECPFKISSNINEN